MLVSVIVPVYGVERFVGKCIESLLNQTYKDCEIIVVDDKTPDSSIKIVESLLDCYPERAKSVRILCHEVNKGLPTARNTGLQAARGEYVLHFDGDDFAEPRMLECMVDCALATGADMVYSDWYLTYDNIRRYMKQPKCNTPQSALEAILAGRMKYNVWNKLVRRSLYVKNNINFPDGHSMGEDMTMIKIVAAAHSVAYLPEAFYCYVKTNAAAMTENISEKAIRDVDHNVADIELFLKQSLLCDERLLSIFKLSVKYPLLFTSDKANYKKWYDWFKDTNVFWGNSIFGIRARCLQFMASRRLYRCLKLHYLLHSFIYNLKYKIK